MAITLAANINGTLLTTVNGQLIPVAYNDIYLNSMGNIATSFDLQAIVEQCAQAAKSLLSEQILNTNIGIPYQQAVWIGVPNVQQFNASLRSAFLNIDGVTEIISLNIIQNNANDTNTLSYNAIINTIYGIGTVNGI